MQCDRTSDGSPVFLRCGADMSKTIFAPDAFTGKSVLISGGTSGIGYAAAAMFLAAGARVVLMGRDQMRGKGAEEQFSATGRALFCAGDVRSLSDCGRVVAEAIRCCGALDVLINAAGIYHEGALDALSAEELDALLDTNIKGTIHLSQAALPYLRQTHGNIVNIASDAGLHGNYFCAAYAATKGAVVALTRSLARETACDGVRVNAVAPADILTPMTERQLAAHLPREDQLREMASLYPLGRIGTADEAAAAVVFLASPAAAWVTGSIYMVDGGLTA